MAKSCPRCSGEVFLKTNVCLECGARVDGSGGWRAAAQSDPEASGVTGLGAVLKSLGHLLVGAMAWVVVMMLALYLGFLQGTGSIFIGAGLLMGLAIACWALSPVVGLLSKK